MDSDPGSKRSPGLSADALLRRNYMFRGLPERTLQRIAARVGRRLYQKGAVIFSQGDPGDALYGVASGRVRISASGAGGREVFLNIMEPGDTFGEIAVMDGLPRTAGATALERTTLIVLKRVDFIALVEQEPRLALHLLKLLCERLRWTSELVEESALLSGPSRLAKRLLILAEQHGRPADPGEGHELEMRISQAELAHFLGISRQIVNQHLGDWAKSGWVRLGRGRIVIADPAALQSLVVDGTSSSG